MMFDLYEIISTSIGLLGFATSIFIGQRSIKNRDLMAVLDNLRDLLINERDYLRKTLDDTRREYTDLANRITREYDEKVEEKVEIEEGKRMNDLKESKPEVYEEVKKEIEDAKASKEKIEKETQKEFVYDFIKSQNADSVSVDIESTGKYFGAQFEPAEVRAAIRELIDEGIVCTDDDPVTIYSELYVC